MSSIDPWTRRCARVVGVALLCVTALACDSPAENAAEEREEQIEERAEERTEALKDAGSVPPPLGDPEIVRTTTVTTTGMPPTTATALPGTVTPDMTTTDAAPRP